MLQPAFHEDKLILLTGVTGSLGGELLPRLVRSFPEHRIAALIRGRKDIVAARLDEVMDFTKIPPAERKRIIAVSGDTSRPNLGLDPGDFATLAGRTAGIFHAAASVAFDLPLDEMRAANVGGTREILAFARRAAESNPNFLLHYVSTAYVAGDRSGVLRESELNCGQGFWNAYEQSKMESEELVAAARNEIPSIVYRPSHIIGSSGSGRIRRFFGIYGFMRLAYKMAQSGNAAKAPAFLIADPDARGDLVPCDYVCDAILCLASQAGAVGGTYHLASGLEASLPNQRVLEIATEVLEAISPSLVKAFRKPRFLKRDAFESIASKAESLAYQSSAIKLLMRTHLPYLAYGRDFDVAATARLLACRGVVMPPIYEVLRDSIRYAIAHSFGEAPAERGATVAVQAASCKSGSGQ